MQIELMLYVTQLHILNFASISVVKTITYKYFYRILYRKILCFDSLLSGNGSVLRFIPESLAQTILPAET